MQRANSTGEGVAHQGKVTRGGIESMARRSLIAMIVLAAVACRPGPEVSLAQQIQLTSPFQTIHDSFYENFGFGGINLGRSAPDWS